MNRPELPKEQVLLQYFTTGETFEDRRYHIIAIGTGKMWHVCGHWCGEKILSEARLERIHLDEASELSEKDLETLNHIIKKAEHK